MFDGTGFVANRKPQFHLGARTVPEAAGRRIHLTLDPLWTLVSPSWPRNQMRDMDGG